MNKSATRTTTTRASGARKGSLTKYRMKQDLIGDSVAYYVPMGVELDDKLQNIYLEESHELLHQS